MLYFMQDEGCQIIGRKFIDGGGLAYPDTLFGKQFVGITLPSSDEDRAEECVCTSPSGAVGSP
jgi:hypothetical protein